MNSTLCYWVSCKEAPSDVVDVVIYTDIGDNKAIELGEENETVINPPRIPRRTSWAYTRTSFMKRRDEEDHLSRQNTI